MDIPEDEFGLAIQILKCKHLTMGFQSKPQPPLKSAAVGNRAYCSFREDIVVRDARPAHKHYSASWNFCRPNSSISISRGCDLQPPIVGDAWSTRIRNDNTNDDLARHLHFGRTHFSGVFRTAIVRTNCDQHVVYPSDQAWRQVLPGTALICPCCGKSNDYAYESRREKPATRCLFPSQDGVRSQSKADNSAHETNPIAPDRPNERAEIGEFHAPKDITLPFF